MSLRLPCTFRPDTVRAVLPGRLPGTLPLVFASPRTTELNYQDICPSSLSDQEQPSLKDNETVGRAI